MHAVEPVAVRRVECEALGAGRERTGAADRAGWEEQAGLEGEDEDEKRQIEEDRDEEELPHSSSLPQSGGEGDHAKHGGGVSGAKAGGSLLNF